MPHQPHLEETQAISVFTPVNLLLLTLALYLIYTRLRPNPSPPPPLHSSSAAGQAIVFKTFTPKTLQPFNGTDNARVYLAVNRKVFDVTAGKGFYGPGGPYSNFAGRDASRGLALNSFDAEVLTEVGAPIDSLEDLKEDERVALNGWAEHFEGKYLLVGRLVEEGSEEAKEAEKEE
ncbi:unnamed protein product [Tuber melanosporum]|jgi:membrane-associated progesterone receptor component|uniref:(Perigord truffle) hypothetical protein n=1 Tax=Tuber melanosporum (strain Mel28) TaxID=656061 RepID=D5G5R9_TUBMM|nr:uncharacterized protein GSTUM_00001452001 [Tuber melanosporum]CAZ79862.1 unnamed protein product [Tuber melanosporum]